MADSLVPNARRFDGFADAYDTHRPSPPSELGALLASYAGTDAPAVVDLGSGSGLSSRWAAAWAASVVGVEPSADMRAVAESRPMANVSYRSGLSDDTGLPDRSADIVLAVQAMHWMEPVGTHAEVARLLRPGGFFAIVDADWPPILGVAEAEAAWITLFRRIRVFEARAHGGVTLEQLRRPIEADDPDLRAEHVHDPHRGRLMPGGVRSWAKSEHLERLISSGTFTLARELCLHQPADGGADRFIALLRNQGSYQGLRQLGLTDGEIGVTDFEAATHRAVARARHPPTLSFSWRVRLGVTPAPGD